MIRQATLDDVSRIQACNATCLPERIPSDFLKYHIKRWPQLQYVAENDGRIVGYVLSTMINTFDSIGHVLSLAVMPTHRTLGIATKLMNATHDAMKQQFGAMRSLLHVRVDNPVALHLYRVLGYEIHTVRENYYADKEDGYEMVRDC